MIRFTKLPLHADVYLFFTGHLLKHHVCQQQCIQQMQRGAT
jgi:hypothetical protein